MHSKCNNLGAQSKAMGRGEGCHLKLGGPVMVLDGPSSCLKGSPRMTQGQTGLGTQMISNYRERSNRILRDLTARGSQTITMDLKGFKGFMKMSKDF